MRISHLLLALSLTSGAAIANESAEALIKDKCTSCHGSEVYTRVDHRIGSFSQLSKQVKRCTQAAGATWFDEDIAAVANYLNDSYYKFNK